jgi:hypothetical protein
MDRPDREMIKNRAKMMGMSIEIGGSRIQDGITGFQLIPGVRIDKIVKSQEMNRCPLQENLIH